jgi:hypothetical protein
MPDFVPGGTGDDGSNVVFLLSSPRAGSTLLSAILGRHSRILCPAEPWYLLSLHALYYGTSSGIAAYDQRVADIGLRELAGEDEFLRAARAFASSLYGSRLAAAGRSVFVDKTPRYYHILPFLATLFPHARMIWLKRDPLDVAASYRTTWGVTVADLVGRDLSPNSFDLTIGLTNFGSWFDGSPGRFEISYEDLVADSDGAVGRILDFLGMERESGLSDYGAGTESMHSLRQSTLGDKKIFEHARPHGRSVGQWREIFSAGELEELLVGIGTDTFLRMGYSETLEAASSKSGFRPGAGHRAPRHLEKLRLYERWFAAAIPLVSAGPERPPHAGDSGPSTDPHVVRLAQLEARLAVAEADREARLAVIEKQGAELGRIPGLEAERDVLAARLATAEADREARLAVIQNQGAELGRMPGLVAEKEALVAERDQLAAQLGAAEADREARLGVIEKQGAEMDSLKSTLRDVGRLAEGAGPKTLLGLAPPSEVRRLATVLSSIATLAQRQRGRT